MTIQRFVPNTYKVGDFSVAERDPEHNIHDI
jgi:hypothetical protein